MHLAQQLVWAHYNMLSRADGTRLQFSLCRGLSTCFQCWSCWLGVCVELAIGCLIGTASWELIFLVAFLTLQFFKVEEPEKTLGAEGLLSLIPNRFGISWDITAAWPHVTSLSRDVQKGNVSSMFCVYYLCFLHIASIHPFLLHSWISPSLWPCIDPSTV